MKKKNKTCTMETNMKKKITLINEIKKTTKMNKKYQA